MHLANKQTKVKIHYKSEKKWFQGYKTEFYAFTKPNLLKILYLGSKTF